MYIFYKSINYLQLYLRKIYIFKKNKKIKTIEKNKLKINFFDHFLIPVGHGKGVRNHNQILPKLIFYGIEQNKGVRH